MKPVARSLRPLAAVAVTAAVELGLIATLGLAPTGAAAQAGIPAAQNAASAPDANKGAALSAAVCSACHSNDGSRGAPANPIIQGQHPDYLVKQLAEYKSGKRDNPIMKGIASTLSADDMRNVAAFYAGKQPKSGAAKNKELALLGEKIWRGGVADRSIPACAGCHGPSGFGIPSQYPRLSGQHADYVEGQLVAFRAGARRNNEVMIAVAAKLNDREIKALSDYSAGLR